MAISYGFFNSVSDDRLYNAESFNTYFEGLVSKNGVYENLNDSMAVSAGTGLTITVGAGKAVVNFHWIKLTAAETLNIATAHNLFPRYDKVSLRWNNSTRDVTLQVVTGTPASKPQKPATIRTTSNYEIVLAYVYVPANATSLTAANIYDQRPNTSICGFITGLIKQVDIADLFAQYSARFAELEAKLTHWTEDQQNIFNAWYYNLTQNLTVGAYIQTYRKVVEGGTGVSNVIPLNMNGYSYDENDVLLPTFNGLSLQSGYDYTLDTTIRPVEMHLNGQLTAGNRFEIVVLKSNMTQTSGGILTSAQGETFIHIDDALPGAAHGFTVGTLGTTNEIAVANRNLFRLDRISTTTVSGLTFTKNSDGSITVAGESEASNVEVAAAIDKNAFVLGQTYTISTGKTAGDTYVRLTLNYSDSTSETFSAKNAPNTFTVVKPVVSAEACVKVLESGTEVNNERIYPQIEVGDTAHEFIANTYTTFTYDGESVPMLTDTIDNIWSNDDNVRDMMIIYVMLGVTDGDDIEY